MLILDPGHLYSLHQLQGYTITRGKFNNLTSYQAEEPETQTVRFVKRVGPKFPGNEAPGYSGTTLQELLRVLINRTIYLNEQESSWHNIVCLTLYRLAMNLLEHRAAKRHRRKFRFIYNIEQLAFNSDDGHIRY